MPAGSRTIGWYRFAVPLELASNILRCLVGAEPQETRVTEPVISGPLNKTDLHDKQRFHPLHFLLGFGRRCTIEN